MKLKGRGHIAAAAWSASGHVQIQIGQCRFTASASEAAGFARQIVAVDALNADCDAK